MTPAEIELIMGGRIKVEEKSEVKIHHNRSHNVNSGTPVDWRSKMNSVKNIGQCGASWAFAATATIEGMYAIKYGNKVILSEQQMIDCATECFGCEGGWISKALEYVKNAGGQVSTYNYGYVAY